MALLPSSFYLVALPTQFPQSFPVVAIESSKLFSRLPAPALQQLRAAAAEKSFGDTELIFKEGDPGDGLYMVKSGAVEISAEVHNGQRQVLSALPPGEIFGEMAVLDEQPRSACASARGDTTVYFLPREPFQEVIRQFPTAAILMMQEISGRLREFNRQYLREVLQAERMAVVGRFASAIVHDLKNPLTILSIATDTACGENATADMRRTARTRMEKQIERITYLVNDILDFTKGASTDLAVIHTDYSTYIQSLIQEFRPELDLKKVAIEFENPPPALKVPINPRRLSRVFHNLIGNAVDAMPNGGRIVLAFSANDSEVLTEIKDSGNGIPQEIIDKLFDPFVTHGKIKGTGLGLSICRRIVEEHGGKISARNHSRGASFQFSLPRDRPK
ncbi:MAG TPA: ATP-binding protein [Verrucomicrobiae bacterium]|nr:ATP-binding protein [Verrucomicrobiae bacterium]